MTVPLARSGPRRVYGTLLTKPSYLPGVLVLAHSLAEAGSQYPLVVLVTPSLGADAREALAVAGLTVRDVGYLEPTTKVEFAEHDARFTDTWTKLAVFRLVEYERVVLLDSDMLVRRNPDELITMELPPGHIAAAHACTCNPRRFSHYPADWCVESVPGSLTAQDA